uniref:Immunoglobulin V-set domain-containing protein n=1 Tax=Hucho hucho TaxID=62062 RepID=A0A4W5KL57_9TELE
MYILATAVCLLGFASAQKVTNLNSCLTKEQNLRMDCEYELTALSPVPTCTYNLENNVVGSTDPAMSPDPTFKNRGTVTIMEGSTTCRLNLTGLSDDKPKNFTCTIKQKETVSKSSIVEKKLLLPCSAWSEHGSMLMMTVTSLVLLLEAKWL